MGDGTLAISTQGGLRVLRVANGYPAALLQRNARQRFWAEQAGTVFRGTTDPQRTRYDQRLNMVAWNALRAALGIPAHTVAAAPVANGTFNVLRNFSFTDAANYSWLSLSGDSSQVDANGNFVANETRKTVSAGLDVPFVRNRSFLVDGSGYGCPNSGAVNVVQAVAPHRSIYCKGYADDRAFTLTLSLGGRIMRDVVNEIRSYGQNNGAVRYGSWVPNPAVHGQLASQRFPDGATMDDRGNMSIATPEGIATNPASDKLRVAPTPTTSNAFNTWPFASSLEDMVAKSPGSLLGSSTINGNVAVYVYGYTETPTDAAYTNQVEIRVAFAANGNKARFTHNNRAVATGFTTNYVNVLDTTSTIETVGGVRLLKFAAMPAGFESRFQFTRRFAERDGAVWCAFKDVPAETTWSIRLNGRASDALRTALGIQSPQPQRSRCTTTGPLLQGPFFVLCSAPPPWPLCLRGRITAWPWPPARPCTMCDTCNACTVHAQPLRGQCIGKCAHSVHACQRQASFRRCRARRWALKPGAQIAEAPTRRPTNRVVILASAKMGLNEAGGKRVDR